VAGKGSRPGGGRPPGRRGKGGIGPGPGYKPGKGGGGTRHTSGSSTGSKAMMWVSVALFGVPFALFLAAVGYVVVAS
jgi:hypothetical protein